MDIETVIAKLKRGANEKNAEGMRRYGLVYENIYGWRVSEIRKLAKTIPKDHDLALGLWATGIREGYLLAPLVDEIDKVTEDQIEKWLKDLRTWEMCDHLTGSLVDRLPFAWDKAHEWAERELEFEKRAAYALMAWLALHDKRAVDQKYLELLPVCRKGSEDERTMVKKGVSWALRRIGARNWPLHTATVEMALEMELSEKKSVKWVAKDVLKDIQRDSILAKLEKKYGKRP